MNISGIVKNILEFGFTELTTSEDEFVNIGNQLGTPMKSRRNGEVIDLLKPTTSINASQHSLSRLFGLSEFPYHTDGAYLLRPPKYILLRYKEGEEDPTPTIILPFLFFLNSDDIDYLRRECWSVFGRNWGFYSSVVNLDINTKQLFLRYDVGCMNCISKVSLIEKIIASQVSRGLCVNISWSPGKTLIINNWMVLHNRPSVKMSELDKRTLQRLMIND
ncbi:hypothetical protein [Chitinophaga sp. ARDCPP14]|uniref:hypothetical protein n=1 Tax=Chitinophaga sp. ARDCPP14 TaxID=3391139 RepID=UPI003F524854